MVSAMPLAICQWKPFNPLIGETYQAELTDGTTVHCEHTSHHPSITNFYVHNPNWKIYGSITYNGKLGGNSFIAFNEGWNTIEFNDGHKLKFCSPALNLKGMLMGTRKIQYVHSNMVVDEQNCLKAVIKFNAEARKGLTSYFRSSRQDSLRGAIYQYDPMAHRKLTTSKKWYSMIKELGEMNDMVESRAEITGSWLSEIKVGDEVVWNI